MRWRTPKNFNHPRFFFHFISDFLFYFYKKNRDTEKNLLSIPYIKLFLTYSSCVTMCWFFLFCVFIFCLNMPVLMILMKMMLMLLGDEDLWSCKFSSNNNICTRFSFAIIEMYDPSGPFAGDEAASIFFPCSFSIVRNKFNAHNL